MLLTILERALRPQPELYGDPQSIIKTDIFILLAHGLSHTTHVCTDLSSPLTWGRGCPSLSLTAAEGGQATSSTAPSRLWVLGRDCSEGCCLLACTRQP